MSDNIEYELEYDPSEDEDSDIESDTSDLDTAPCELEDDTFGFAQSSSTPNWTYPEHTRTRSKSIHQDHTASLRARLEQSGDIAQRVRNVLDFMTTQSLNIPLFLWAIFYNVDDLVPDTQARYARTTLTHSKSFRPS